MASNKNLSHMNSDYIQSLEGNLTSAVKCFIANFITFINLKIGVPFSLLLNYHRLDLLLHLNMTDWNKKNFSDPNPEPKE
ncbi:hypothetical protein BpHYR1_013972 [Brachionus plicatilis]|uniref:Uncharacterized protein n=1 Tax=Brachionus plicatilis TaxID=10195 RepID=A0A3M7SSX6_BRAPC|nr:hypothetical protein BpHYR1_013972 [Brachionus plicatilis]